MKRNRVLLLILALMALGTTAWAQEAHVTSEGALRDAIATSSQGTTIYLEGNISIETGELVFNKSIILDLNGWTLTAHYHIRVTDSVIGSNTIHNTLQVYNSDTIRPGTIKGKYPQGDGGAIYIDEGNTLEIFSGTIKGDVSSTHNGGVIYNAGTLKMYGGKITNGYAANGGGVYNTGTMTLDLGSDGGSIESCTASTNGGGVYNAGTLTINRGTIGGIDETDPDNPVSLGNTATNQGGGIYSTGTINLNGGSITSNSAANGGGIHMQGGSLTFTSGSISQNSSTGNCGGLNITYGANVTMSGGSIANNTAGGNDGGVYLGSGSNALTMTGGSITGNTANGTSRGGGLSDNGGTLTMSGNPIVMGNLANGTSNNVYLPSGKKITVNGAFTTGATVGVTCADGVGTTFTSGYGTYTHEGMAFASDDVTRSVVIVNGEAQLQLYNPTGLSGTIQYLNVDATGDHGMADCAYYVRLSDFADNDHVTLSQSFCGWYVVDKNLTFNNRITIEGTVNLILMDNTRLTANKGVYVPGGATLHIWGQSTKQEENDMMGILNATANEKNYAGIGGHRGTDGAGILYFHGGFCSGVGGENAAGINGAVAFDDNYTVRIYGGNVFGVGGTYGAGIGGGFTDMVGSILITGGYVFGHDGYKGAGIGSGYAGKNHDMQGGYSGNPGDNRNIIRITGGHVFGWGTTGAGIGGGEGHDIYDGDPVMVYIEGGTVEAKTDDGLVITQEGGGRMGAAVAIGWGSLGMGIISDYIHFYEGAKISASTSIHGDVSLQTFADGRSKYRTYKQMKIEPCEHPEHNNPITYTNNTENGNLSVNCPYCHTTEPYTFETAGNWNNASHWLGSIMPGAGKDVAVKAAATIPSTCCAHVGHIDLQDGGSITINDGGQLIHSNAVMATVKKDILGYATSGNIGGWNFIATPIAAGTTPSMNNYLLDITGNSDYDLYYYDEPAHLWRNHKDTGTAAYPNFNLANGQGYLYAHSNAVDLLFEGVLQAGSSNGTYTVNGLSYGSDDANLKGWNLVGNPFACNATIDRPCYTLSGNVISTEAHESGYVIPPCTGVMVKADEEHDNVIFTKVIPTTQSTQPNAGSLQITLSQAVNPSDPSLRGTKQSSTIDNAIVSFTEGNTLGKFYFGEPNANIYIPQGGEEYAIAVIARRNDEAIQPNEIPVNFKANENGQYTITVNPEGVEMAYLHLIDNMTGADIDLLPSLRAERSNPEQPASYTFTAKTTDYESRFKLVFACGDANDDNDGDNEAFAFISDGNIIVNGEGTLQVMDVTGRIIVNTDGVHTVSTSGMTPGVYVLRLVNGNNVRTQKIVIE